MVHWLSFKEHARSFNFDYVDVAFISCVSAALNGTPHYSYLCKVNLAAPKITSASFHS